MPAGRSRISTTVFLDPWQVTALEHLKKKTNVPTAVRIRDSIYQYLLEQGYTKPNKLPTKKKLLRPDKYGSDKPDAD